MRHDIFIGVLIIRMISFEKYQSMAQSQKAEILWLEGVYLELIRQTPLLNIELYALYDFYVEIYFDKATEEPLFLRAFQDPVNLEPYLSLVDIKDALEIRNDGMRT